MRLIELTIQKRLWGVTAGTTDGDQFFRAKYRSNSSHALMSPFSAPMRGPGSCLQCQVTASAIQRFMAAGTTQNCQPHPSFFQPYRLELAAVPASFTDSCCCPGIRNRSSFKISS